MRPSFYILFAAIASAVYADTMFKSKNVKVHVGFGYYTADLTYKYSATGNSYLRYDFSTPTKMIELIDYAEGTRSKVCSKCEVGFYPYSAPILFSQASDIPTGEEDGECKEYTPGYASSVVSIWYKGDGTLCNVTLEDGRRLEFVEAIDKTFSDNTVFNLEGRECPAPVCKRVMDLVFVLDSSGSIDDDAWSTVKGFLKKMASALEIGADATMVGIVSYGSKAVKVTDITGDKSKLTTAIEGATYCAGTTCTGCGIEMAMDMLASTSDARNTMDPEKIIMLITDGDNNEKDRQQFCRKYQPKCTKYGTACKKYKCLGDKKTINTSVCTKWNITDKCLKYKCGKCTKRGPCLEYKTECERWSTTKCLNYSSTFCEGNPSRYCCRYDSFDGSLRNIDICGKCECTEYRCDQLACELYKCKTYDCDECQRDSTTCLIPKKECLEYETTEICAGNEQCVEYECLEGTIECAEKGLGANSMLAGAVSRTRTEWSLYPASKRVPIVFAIGVKGANMYELKGIASTLNGKQFVYKVNEFSDLYTIINDLVDETCTKQTASLEGCSADCLGFCGCDKQCYCPTCDTPTGSCYSFTCVNDSTSSTGCVPNHKSCSPKNKCYRVTPDNSTADCCRQDAINCQITDDKCLVYGCDPNTGCTVKPLECIPEDSCHNLTGCDNKTEGCQYISACPYLGPCNISTCTPISSTDFECTYTDKCTSDDLCQIPVCNVETGECSLEPVKCIPSNPCNTARCYMGRCIEEVNITRKIECASLANSSCYRGFCNESDGQCVLEEVDEVINCQACEENTTLDCSEYNTGCATYTCAPVDDESLLTQCVPQEDACPPSEDPCIIRQCTDDGRCLQTDVQCEPAADKCHYTRCITDPLNNKTYKCETYDTFAKPDDACFENYCDENGLGKRRNKCEEKNCFTLIGCEVNATGGADCIYKPIECPSGKCFQGYCDVETGSCMQYDNSSNCDIHNPCKIPSCDAENGCEYVDITCDDKNPCTIDKCVPIIFETSGSSTDANSSETLNGVVYDSSDSYTSSELENGYVCVYEPKCTTSLFCQTVSCNANGTCVFKGYECEDMNANSTLDKCHMYTCDEERRGCKISLAPSAFLDVCGTCLAAINKTSSTDCLAGMKLPNFAAAIGGAAIAAIVIAAIIVAAVIGVSSTLGTRELMKRAKKNADAGTNTNPLYEGNEHEFSNPTFTGEE